ETAPTETAAPAAAVEHAVDEDAAEHGAGDVTARRTTAGRTVLVVPTLHVVLGAAQCLCGQRRGGPRVLDGGRRIGLGGLLSGLQVPLGLRQAGACLGA